MKTKSIKKSYFLSLLFIALIAYSCSDNDDNSTEPLNQFTDSRDGQVYKTVTIGTQTWFAENLNFDTGDTNAQCYDEDEINCFIYGKLYEGATAQTVCPEGWHLPSVEEYQTLIDYLGGIEAAYVFLAPFAEQQGESIGFNMLPAGRYFANWVDVGEMGYYYTSTPGGYPNSYRILEFDPGNSVSFSGATSSNIKQSCRCVKD